MDKTVKLVKHFNLFRLEPVYTFSVVTSQTGIIWAFLLSFTLLTVPLQFALGPTLAILIVQIILVTAAFVLPLQMVNQRLVAEKRRLLAEHNERVRSALARLHSQLDDDKLSGIAELNHALTGLAAEGGILEKIPTWPWRAGLFTGFISIVVLPIAIFLIQLALGRLVGK